jgi:hypothetical protein
MVSMIQNAEVAVPSSHFFFCKGAKWGCGRNCKTGPWQPRLRNTPSANSSFFYISLLFMNELAKAVLVLALSTAVAVWLLGAALHLWPDTGQLAYGNSLPYLKVKFDRPANAVKFWVEDFGNMTYERVWLYVNGQLKVSGGPGTNATAKCGDEVAAVVKYHSGVKKLEGRILCTKPIKVSKAVTDPHFETRTALAAQDIAGDVDVTGLPIDIRGTCHMISVSQANFAVYITPRAPDVLICDKSGCSPSKTYTFTSPEFYSIAYEAYNGPIDVLKPAGAPLARYAGGGRLWLNLTIYHQNDFWYLVMNGTVLAYCGFTYGSSEMTVTEYREAPASALYQLYLQWPDGRNIKTTVAIYDQGDSFGFRVISSGTTQPPPPGGAEIPTRYGPVKTDVDLITGVESLRLVDRFFNWLDSNPDVKTAFVDALYNPGVTEHNIPMTSETYKKVEIGLQPVSGGYSYAFFIKTLHPFSLGAVFANTVLPVNITRPPKEALTLSGGPTYLFSYLR